jgi:hypothetical protein
MHLGLARNPQLANVNIKYISPSAAHPIHGGRVTDALVHAHFVTPAYMRKMANMICNLQRHKLSPIGAARRERAVSSRAHLHSVGREKRSCSRLFRSDR